LAASSEVSIVINAYDEDAALLARAVESAMAQTVPAAEIILVDDGSPRDYTELLRAYPAVRSIRQANAGLAAARNTGLKAAVGKYVVFLDGDDRLLPHAIAHNLRRFGDRPGAVMAYGGYRFIDGAGRPSFQATMPPLGADAYETMLEGNCIGMHATVMYRRDVLLELGGFDSGLPACEDYELYLRIARRYPIVSGSEVVAEYRQHDGNMSNDSAMMLVAATDVLRQQRPHVRDNPRWRQAWSMGMREWKEFYARSQLLAVQRSLGDASRRRPAVIGLCRLSRLAPFTIVKVVAAEVLTRLRVRWSHGGVDFGDLRRTTPISRHFGYDRGKPVDRRYIEDFLERHAADIRGRVLEIGDNSYTVRFGGDRVERSEILHVDPTRPNVTYSADLADGSGLPDDTFDCIVLTQTLHLIFDLANATRTLRRILKPGGVVLLTVPGVSSVDSGEWGGTWYWSFTPASLGRLLQREFRDLDVAVTGYGNVLSATAFLYGLAEDELRDHELNACDPHYPTIVAARAVKSSDGSVAR